MGNKSAYGEAQLSDLRLALGAVALFSILGLWFTRRLPTRLGAGALEAEPLAAAQA